MLTDAFIQQVFDTTRIQEDKKVPLSVRNVKPKRDNTLLPTIFVPREKDTLFWCYYAMTKGMALYEQEQFLASGGGYGHGVMNNAAKQKKIALLTDTIRTNKDVVKQYKFDTLVGLEGNLGSDEFLSVGAFLTLCAIAKCNLFFVSIKRTVLELPMTDTKEGWFVVYETLANPLALHSSLRYGFEVLTREAAVAKTDEYFRVPSLTKPMRAASYYKVAELQDIVVRLQLVVPPEAKKQDLYEKIVAHFQT